MNCRKSYAIDLAAFLAGNADPSLEEFRAHCRDCADCAAEVRAWSELHARLRGAADGAHPAEEALLAFEEKSSSLDSRQRRSIEQHLASCPSCRDELTSLRAFDFASLQERDPGRGRDRRGALTHMVAGLRALILHPAFAYALVFLLLVPALVEHSTLPLATPPRPAGEAKPAAQAPIGPLSDRLKEEAHVGEPKEEASQRKPEASEREASENDLQGIVSPRQQPLAAAGGAARPAARERAPAAAPPASAGFADAQEGAAALGAEARMRKSGWASSSAGPALDLDPQHVPEIVLPPAEASLLLRVPLPAADTAAVELVVVSPDGRRQLRERAPRSEDGKAEVRVPGAWFEIGQHRVEVYLGDGRVKPASSYPFIVRAPLGDRRPPLSALHGSPNSQ